MLGNSALCTCIIEQNTDDNINRTESTSLIYNSCANQLPNHSLAGYHNRYSTCKRYPVSTESQRRNKHNIRKTNEITKRLACIQSRHWRGKIWFQLCFAKTAEKSHFTNITYTLMLRQRARRKMAHYWTPFICGCDCLFKNLVYFSAGAISLFLSLTHEFAQLPRAGNRTGTFVLKNELEKVHGQLRKPN